MSKIVIPTGFSSFEEYDAYYTCINKAMPGDQVEIYLLKSDDPKITYTPSKIKTTFTEVVNVVGFRNKSYCPLKYSKELLLGSDYSNIGFYSHKDRDVEKFCKNNIFPYTYMYWGVLADVRFKRIILKCQK